MSDNVIDFNDARSTGPARPERDVELLKRRLADQARSVLAHLLPGGRIFGQEYIIGDWSGKPGDSLKISLRPDRMGVGGDYATGQMAGDLIDCWQLAKGVDFTTACAQAEAWLGLPPHLKPAPPKPAPHTEELPPASARWHYHDAAGNIAATVHRHDMPDGSKTFRTWDAKRRVWKFPEQRLLYRLPEILTADRVVIVEGEKSADALAARGFCATTPMGGSKAPIELTDWSPLQGRHVIVWADADRTGLEHAERVANAARANAAASVRLLTPPGDKPKGWDAADAIREGFDIEGFLADPLEPGSFETSLPMAWFGDIQPCLDTDDFVEDLLCEQQFSVVYGESNCGKTFFALDMALHVALGRPWCGRAVEQGGVIYCVLEGGKKFANRIVAFKQRHGLDDVSAPLAVIQSAVNLLDPKADTPKLIAAIEAAKTTIEGPVKLVIVDTLSRSMAGGDENSAEAMTAVIANADAIRAATGAHLMFIHHTGKDTARGARGHSSLRAATDTEIEVTVDHEAKISTATVTKQRDLDTEGTIPFKLIPVELGTNRRGKPITSCVIEQTTAPAAEPGKRKAKPKLTDFELNVLKKLRNMIADNSPKPEFVPGCPAVLIEDLKDALIRDKLLDGTPGKGLADTPRKAWNRALNALVAKEKVVTQGEYIWVP